MARQKHTTLTLDWKEFSENAITGLNILLEEYGLKLVDAPDKGKNFLDEFLLHLEPTKPHDNARALAVVEGFVRT